MFLGVQDLWQFVTGEGSEIIKNSVTYFMDGPLGLKYGRLIYIKYGREYDIYFQTWPSYFQ